MFHFAEPRATRRTSLTPMIDVVFLLLVFFMLAARFGQDVSVPFAPAGSDVARYEGPPRLVEFARENLWLNGAPIAAEDLAAALAPLMPDATALVILRPREEARVQDLTRLSDRLRDAGIANLVVMEP